MDFRRTVRLGLLAALMAGSCAAENAPAVDERGLDSEQVMLRGVRQVELPDVAALFPRTRGAAGVYDQGRLVLVFDPDGQGGLVESVIVRTGDTVDQRDTRIYKVREDQRLLVAHMDPTTLAMVELPEAEWDVTVFAGKPGVQHATRAGVLRYDGIEEVEIAGAKYECARFATIMTDGAEGRRQWIDVDSGLPVLDAMALKTDRLWRVRRQLERIAQVPEAVIESEKAVDHVRRTILDLGAKTIDEPSDREIVPVVPDEAIDPTRAPQAPAEAPDRVLLRKIVVHHRMGGSVEGVGRGEDAAINRAEALVRLARKRDVSFSEVARFYSDDPTAFVGGYAGVYDRRELGSQDDAVKAGFAIGIGQVSDPVRLKDAHAIVTREEIVELSAARILLGHTESQRPVPGVRVTRTKAEAIELAKQIKQQVAAGQSFADLAKTFSDAPEGRHGGSLGIFTPGSYDAAIEAALGRLEIGDVSAPMETIHGVVVLQRQRVERVRATFLRIAWKDALRAGPEIQRTKEEARDLALAAMASMEAPAADAAAIAVEYSDEALVDDNRGDTGWMDPARLPAHMVALPGMEFGKPHGPVEAPNGFYVFVRTK